MQGMTVIRKFAKIGDGVCLLFSAEDLKRIGIDDPSRAEIEILAEKNHIILRPVKKESKKDSESF